MAVTLLPHGDAMFRRPSVSHGDIMRPEIQAMFHVEHIILYSNYPAGELFSAFIKRHGDAQNFEDQQSKLSERISFTYAEM